MTRRLAWIAVALVFVVGAWWLLRRGGVGDRRPLHARAEPRTEGTTSLELRASDGVAPLRDVVESAVADDIERGVPSAAPPSDAASEDAPAVVLRGRATFRHGGPVPDLPLIAVALDAPPDVSPERDPTRVFGRARTGDDGSFELRLDERGIASAAFRLRMASPLPLLAAMPWRDDDRVHAVDPEREIMLVYDGALVTILAVDAGGAPVPGATLSVEFDDPPRGERKRTDERGRAEVPYRGAPTITVQALAQDSALAAGPLRAALDDRVGDLEIVVELLPVAFDAELDIEVVDATGTPVEHFAVRVRFADSLGFRYVLSEDLAPGGRLRGLRPGPATIAAWARLSAPPALYDTLRSPWVEITLSRERPARARLVVDGERGGIEFDVVRDPDGPSKLLLFVRSAPDEPWKPLRGVWMYEDDGSAMSGVDFAASGVYWVGELTPGRRELSVRAPDDEELERIALEIFAGRYTRVELRR